MLRMKASDEKVAMASRQLNTLSLEKIKPINESADKSNSTNKLDFITRLPLELVTDIMKYFETHELVKMLSVSKGWKKCLLESPALWSTWSIDRWNYDWDDPTILATLPRVGQYISEIRLTYSTSLTQFTKTLLNHISNGTLNRLENLYLYDCYISTKKTFRLPATALLKLANTLKKLEITYDEDLFDYDYDDNYINDKDQGNEMFISTTSMDSATFDIFRLAISALHQLEYFRYVNPQFFDSPSSSPLSTFFTMNNNNSFSSSLKHLEIELGSIEARYVERILKQCPNLLILWLMSLRAYTDTSILDTIRQYCPRLEYILFDYKGDLLYGQDLFELYVPKSPGRSHAETTTPLASQSPSIPSTSSSLKKLHINIHNTNHVIPFLNHYSDTIEEMMLSFHRDYQQSLSSVHLLNQLVSLVVTHLEYPVVLATLLPKLPSLQILEFDNSHMGDNELINALKHVNTLKELKIRNGRYAVVDHMVDLFNAYAEASTIATFNSSIKELKEANSAGNRSLSEQQLCGGGQLAHVSLIDCDFIADPVLEALGNIKTLSSVYISYMYYVTTKGINAFCEQLNLLPDLRSITLSGLDCVDDSTLFILASSSTATRSHDIMRAITLESLDNVTKEGLDQLSKKKGVSVILR